MFTNKCIAHSYYCMWLACTTYWRSYVMTLECAACMMYRSTFHNVPAVGVLTVAGNHHNYPLKFQPLANSLSYTCLDLAVPTRCPLAWHTSHSSACAAAVALRPAARAAAAGASWQNGAASCAGAGMSTRVHCHKASMFAHLNRPCIQLI